MKKQQLFKTAYSPLFEVYVKIDHAHQDDRGEWIYTCSNRASGMSGHLFRASELTNFVL